MSTSSLGVRAELVTALKLDLVGPAPGHSLETETLSIAPSRFYLTGFLVPHEADPQLKLNQDIDEELDSEEGTGTGDDERAKEQASARRVFFPSSMGVSVCVAPSTKSLKVEVSWGDYEPLEGADGADGGDAQKRWKRTPRTAKLDLSLAKSQPVKLEDSNGVRVHVLVRKLRMDDALAKDSGIPPGSKAVSVFVVNDRRPDAVKDRDRSYIFQVALTLRCADGFCARPNLSGLRAADGDFDERVADLQFRDAFEYVVGHGVSAEAELVDGHCRAVHTRWVASAEVEKVIAASSKGELDMKRLSECATAADARALLDPLVNEYGKWIGEQAKTPLAPDSRVETLRLLVSDARAVQQRIADGVALLEHPKALQAFRLANAAMEMQARRRNLQKSPPDTRPPAWRPFQLAFLLMNLNGIAEGTHADRERVDLLFFPTGGGKTEAYLGLAAFTLVLRRLNRKGISSAGVAVLMRYTLRLLTLDQLHRASALICALELLRRRNPAELGDWPFEIGLWVGRAATPNRIGRAGDGDENSARKRTIDHRLDSRRFPSPVPIEVCPWCGGRLKPTSFSLEPNDDAPNDLRIICLTAGCDFRGERLPVLTVDEAIYRRLPCFLVATLDKFAGLPWEGRSGALFGKVQRHDAHGFYGPCDPGSGTALTTPLLPPELIIQDELHLISGPLGTMAGLYETAIDALSTRIEGQHEVRPKIVASTATVRRAQQQICALFARNAVDIFPPPGPDRRDSFFARTVPPSARPARLYLGIAAAGRSMKVALLRSYVALLAAAQKAWDRNGGAPKPGQRNSADPYMTLVGYFNSLRELGGSRRIIEDEVTSRLIRVATERLREGQTESDFANRRLRFDVVELTSRESNARIAEYKRRLERPHDDEDHVDVAIATNMISVGLDILRLGLMVVLGQPKATAEYIQATSRVGRDEELGPGLVVTLLNPHKPRDRSHYERFESYHRTFYRSVEPTSVTPFARRAVDRGLPAVSVGLSRHGVVELTPPKGALTMGTRRQAADWVAEALGLRAERSTGLKELRGLLKARTADLLDDWSTIAREQQQAGAGLQYQREAGNDPALLHTPLDPALAELDARRARFKANRSLRDVEPSVNLFVRALETGQFVEEDVD